jgi:hypothetical protein
VHFIERVVLLEKIVANLEHAEARVTGNLKKSFFHYYNKKFFESQVKIV